LSESFVEHTQPQSSPVPTSTAEPNEVSATPRASSARKPKQSKPVS
jgi:hypothetical protein